jgi:glycosyltransferase involved in cell wall biosynthesis
MKELWLFTRQYPTGRGEAFLEAAIDVWRRHFQRVLVLPMYEGEGRTELPEGVEHRRLWEDADAFKPMPMLVSLLRVHEVMALLAKRGDGWRSDPRLAGLAQNHARQLLYKAAAVERLLMPGHDPRRVVMLSAWMEDWVNVLGLVKQRVPGMHFATMAHGWDLFEQRRSEGLIPYRAAQMEWVDQVYCIARSGMAHLAGRHPQHASKLRLAHLGTPDRGAAPWAPDPVLRLVSCAYLRAPKRVADIAAALCRVQRPVRWTHFGDGPDRAALEAVVAQRPAHVEVRLMGNVPHGEVMRHHASDPADLFIHLSAQEGVPVALMEAASFGIPLVANEVGGVAEVLTPDAGTLLPADTGPEALATWLDSDAPQAWCHAEARAQVRAAWQRGFDASRNFGDLAEALKG